MSPRRYSSVNGEASESRRHKPDYILLVAAAMLIGVGIIVLVAISPALTAQKGISGSYYVSRQLIALLMGVVLFFAASRLNLRMIKALRMPLVVLSVIAAGLVFAISGVAFRWIQIGSFSFQPAELVKFTIIVVAAVFLADQVKKREHTDTHKTLVPVGIGFGAVAFITVILERDLGSMVVMTAIILSMLLVANVPLGKLSLVLVGVLLLGALAIMSTQYRRDRFSTFINPEKDCSSTGYHACQALIAVGSGGVFGQGIDNSGLAYGYLPEAANDSIFAIYAEKFGFIGSIILISLYGLLMVRILRIAQRAADMTSRLIATGVLGWLGVQTMINIGAMLGLLPLKGITLPFISYGGTSLMFVLAALGLVFRISSHTLIRRSLGEPGRDERDEAPDSGTYRRGNSRPRYAALSRR